MNFDVIRIEIDINMDNGKMTKRPIDDATRESLIAISYGVPETDANAEYSPENKDEEKVVESPTYDGDEKYRSELISISCSLSPDAKVSPPGLPRQP